MKTHGSVVAFLLALGLLIGASGTAEAETILGTGTGALIGGDLTDPENDGLPDADTNYNATFTCDDEPGFGGGEFSFNVFDNLVGGGTDKWCCNDPSPGNPLYGPGHQLSAQFASPVVLRSFTITSSNDSPPRDPLDWQIQGSNDGTNFTPIFDSGSTNYWPGGERNTVVLFRGDGTDYAEPPAYSHIRYSVTESVGTSMHALCELEYFDTLNYPPPPPPPEFNVRMIQVTGGGGSNDNDINDTSEALSIVGAATGTGLVAIGAKAYNVNVFVDGQIDVIDYAGGGGNFGVDNNYPDGRSDPGDDFLVRAQAYLDIPAGTYTIAFGSDDGGMLSLAGITFDSTFNENAHNGVGTNEVRYEGTRGHEWTGGTFTVSGQTLSELISVMFERGGGDSFEIALAQGTHTSFSAANFQLLENGLYEWEVSKLMLPEPATLILAGLAMAGLGGYVRRRRRA